LRCWKQLQYYTTPRLSGTRWASCFSNYSQEAARFSILSVPAGAAGGMKTGSDGDVLAATWV
jgi:hypothetical protein